MLCKDKIALVTGAAGNGIGRSTALTLAREGASVIINYLTSSEQAQSMVHHIKGQGGKALAVHADIGDKKQCQYLVDTSLSTFQKIDICIINPGAGWHPESIDKLNSDAALDDARKELAPVYHLLPLVLPGMYAQKWGRIVGISLLAMPPTPAYAYNSAKAARTNALLLAFPDAWKNGVTINVIAPGPIGAVAGLDEAIGLCAHNDLWKYRSQVTAQDIAEGILMFCTDTSRFISGCELPYRNY